MRSPGRLVVLNGTSSAGKTTLATAFRDARAEVGDYWLILGIDDVLSKLPIPWLDLGLAAGPGAFAADGLAFDRGPDGVVGLHVGSVCRRLLELYHRTVAVAVRSGLNVIVDDVVVDQATLDDWFVALDGLEPTWVAAHCSPGIAEDRERARGDRPVGMARVQQDIVHRNVPYTIEIDTGALAPDQALLALSRGLGYA